MAGVMMHFISPDDKSDQWKTEYRYWSKFWARNFVFNFSIAAISAYVLQLYGYSAWWNFTFLLPITIAFQMNYDRLMSWLNNRNGYFWLIMLASFILTVVFLWEAWIGYMRSI